MRHSLCTLSILYKQCDQKLEEKVSKIFQKDAQKVAIMQNIPQHHQIFWLLLKENSSQKPLKMAQSGHTGFKSNVFSVALIMCQLRHNLLSLQSCDVTSCRIHLRSCRKIKGIEPKTA